LVAGFYKVCNQGPYKNWFKGNVKWKIGDGRRVKFWKDKWVDDQLLKDKFQRLFCLSLCKKVVMAEVGTWEYENVLERVRWNLNWRRERFKWEKELEVQLINNISNIQGK